MMKAYRSILIVKMSSLGDVLHALPTLYALRENNPHARIAWACLLYTSPSPRAS